MITLLQNYINEEISKYVEPVREGTAKGDPIGLSSVKFKSTLLFLTNLQGKEIAKAVGVSYGLLRVWRTENLYLSTIEKHENFFSRMVLKHIVDSTEGIKTKRPSFNKIINLFSQDFADISIYSDRLMSFIYQQGTKSSYYDRRTFYHFLPYLAFIFVLRKNYGQVSSPEIIHNPRKVYSGQGDITYLDIFEAFQWPWTPDEEKAKQAKINLLKGI